MAITGFEGYRVSCEVITCERRSGLRCVRKFAFQEKTENIYTVTIRGLLAQGDIKMPDVHISWLAGRTIDQKRKVVEGITKLLMEEAGAKPESTHIVFVDIPHTDFASGGMLVADKQKKT
jgi:4-oxalocrotonate tautomerase